MFVKLPADRIVRTVFTGDITNIPCCVGIFYRSGKVAGVFAPLGLFQKETDRFHMSSVREEVKGSH